VTVRKKNGAKTWEDESKGNGTPSSGQQKTKEPKRIQPLSAAVTVENWGLEFKGANGNVANRGAEEKS